jgi:replicative DNA helicase
MTANQLAARAVSEFGRHMGFDIPYVEASAGRANFQDAQKMVKASVGMADLRMTIDETSGLTLSEIAARVRKTKAANPDLGLVIVDHIGKIRPSGRYRGDRVNEVTEISGGLAEIAKSERICVLALSQLNRKVEERDNKRPSLADLRDSGSLEQDADVVMFAFRPAYYLERNKFDEGSEDEITRLQNLEKVRNVLEVGVAKNRNGRTGTVQLFVDLATNYICGMEQTDDQF